MGSVDQAVDVRDDDPFVVPGHTQVRLDRRERVVGDLRARGRQP